MFSVTTQFHTFHKMYLSRRACQIEITCVVIYALIRAMYTKQSRYMYTKQSIYVRLKILHPSTMDVRARVTQSGVLYTL